MQANAPPLQEATKYIVETGVPTVRKFRLSRQNRGHYAASGRNAPLQMTDKVCRRAGACSRRNIAVFFEIAGAPRRSPTRCYRMFVGEDIILPQISFVLLLLRRFVGLKMFDPLGRPSKQDLRHGIKRNRLAAFQFQKGFNDCLLIGRGNPQ